MSADFSLNDLLDPQRCYDHLVEWLHPDGLGCPNGHNLEEARIHERKRAPVFGYLCGVCGRCFNVFTDTVLKRIRHDVVQIIQLLRGIVQCATTSRLARELCVDRKWLLVWRHRLQELAYEALDKAPLEDPVTEVDEVYQNAGEKGDPHLDPDDPPRRRANKVRGHGTWDNDRVPIFGIVGRESCQIRLAVCHQTTRAELQPLVLAATLPGAVVNSDEWCAYTQLDQHDRVHWTVRHKKGAEQEWARDDDGDGIREVHSNTIEGIWTGLRNSLRPFRGVNKEYLHQYIAIFEWSYNLKTATSQYLRALLGVFSSNAP